MLRLVGAAILAISMCLFWSGVAAGAPVGGNDERLVEANAHMSRAEAADKSHDYVAAGVEFREAYALFSAVARPTANQPPNKEAHNAARYCLIGAGRAYGLVEEMPVESFDAFTELKAAFGTELSKETLDGVEKALERLDARIGKLDIRGVPTDVQTRLDGVLLAPALLRAPMRVAAGRHSIEVQGERYKPFSASTNVVPHETARFDVALEKSEVVTRLRMEANVTTAMIAFDKDPPVRLPLERTVPPGFHSYTVTAEGYREETGTVETEPAERALVRVTMVRRRNPIGIRIDPALTFSSPLRGDTPLNNNVGPNRDFSDGTGLAVGVRLQIFYDFLHTHALNIGLTIDYTQRPIAKVGFGPVFEWCPDFLTWNHHKAALCPVSAAYLITAVGDVQNFDTGSYGLRGGSKFEARFDALFFSFGGGLGYQLYTRNAIKTLGVGTAFTAIGVGVDL